MYVQLDARCEARCYMFRTVGKLSREEGSGRDGEEGNFSIMWSEKPH